MAPPNRYDQSCRYLAHGRPEAMLGWLLRLGPEAFSWHGWVDTRNVPFTGDPEGARPYFRELRELRDSLARNYPNVSLDVLSMGMSHDFEVAIEEGSTCLRIGTAIFGERPRKT